MKKEWTEQDLREFVRSAQAAFEDVTLTEADEEAAPNRRMTGPELHETTSELPSEKPPVPGCCAKTDAHFSTGNPFSGRFP